jgi:anti-sigma factor RsiW
MNLDDILLMTYVDGEALPQQCAAIEAALKESPDLARRVSALRAARLPYQAAFSRQDLAPVPESLVLSVDALVRDAARDAKPTIRREAIYLTRMFMWLPGRPHQAPPHEAPRGLPESARFGRRRFALSGLGLAFVAGILCCDVAIRFAPELSPFARTRPLPWIQAVAEYQDLYTRETLVDLKDNVNQTANTIQQIRRDDALALDVPDLRAAGLDFKQLRRLRFRRRPLVQILYLPEHGGPVALCVITDSKPDQSLQTQQVGEMKVVTWRRDRLSYALVSSEPAVDLLTLGAQIATHLTPTLFDGASNADPAPAAPRNPPT